MISFDGLNMLTASFGVISTYSFIKFYLKRKLSLGLLSTICVCVFLGSFYLSSIIFRGVYTNWYIKAEINQNPLMQTVKENYPSEYKAFITQAEMGFSSRAEKEKILKMGYELTNRIFLISLKNATESEIHDYVHSSIELYTLMIKYDPEFVVKFEHGDPALALDFNYLMGDIKIKPYLKRALLVREEVIKDSTKHPIQTTDPKIGLAVLQKIMGLLTEKYGAQAVTYTFTEQKNNLPAEVKANVILHFFQALATLDKASRISAVRYIGVISAESAHATSKKD